MEEREYVELRSDEVQEILGTPPGWLVRWGTFIVFICVAALLGTAAMISYPDVVEASIVITPTTPPVDVVARTDGYITKSLVKDKAMVKQGDVLGVLQSTAKYEHIESLSKQIDSWLKYPPDSLGNISVQPNLELGELQADYAAFIQDVANYRFGKEDKSSSVQQSVGSISRQIDKLDKSIGVDQKATRRLQLQLSTAKESYRKQQELYDAGLISRVDLEKERQGLDDLERQIDALQESIYRKQNEILNLRKNRNEVSFGERADEATLASRLRRSLNTLRVSLDVWKQNYLLTAPIDGQVTLPPGALTNKQFIRRGDQVLTIIPPKSDNIIGRMYLSAASTGKIKESQKVIIKLDAYPYFEYGTLQGYVVSKSLIPKDNKYTITIGLPHGLKTSHQTDIPFEQQLQGQGQIIIEEKRFLQRIYEQVFATRY